MAKRKPMNQKRRLRALETAGPAKARNPVALALAQRRGGGTHGDLKKRRSREACRGRVRLDG